MAESKWYFTPDQLINSPSKKCGIDADQELNYRQLAANLIQDMGRNVRVNQLCINTAIVYMHRFYAFHSFTHFHRDHIAAAALFLAAKVEEQPRKLELVIRSAYWCTHKDGPPFDPNSPQGVEQAQDLIFNENVLLQTLGFDVAIDHPHTHIVKACHLVRAHKDLAQTSYFMASNSLHMTTMCLQYKPTVVACFCIHLACKWSNWEIPQSNEGKPWFSYVDPTVNAKLLEQLTNDFLHIFDRCTSRLKRKILSIRDQSPSLGQSSPSNNANSPFDKEPRKIEPPTDSALSNIMILAPSLDDFKPVNQPSTSNDCFLTPAPPPPQHNLSVHGQQSSLSTSTHSQINNSFHNQTNHSNNLSHGHKNHHAPGALSQNNQTMGLSKNMPDGRRISHKPTGGVTGHSSGVFSALKPVSQRSDNKDLDSRKVDHDKHQSTKSFIESNATNQPQDERSSTYRQQRMVLDKSHPSMSKPSHSRFQKDSSSSFNTSLCSSSNSTRSDKDASTSQRHNTSHYDELTNTRPNDVKMDSCRQLKSDYQNKTLQQKPGNVRHGEPKNGIVGLRNDFKHFSKPPIPISSYHKHKDAYSNDQKISIMPKTETKLDLNLDDLSKSTLSKNQPKTHRTSIFSPDNKEPLIYKKPKSPLKVSTDKKFETSKRTEYRRPQEITHTNPKPVYDKDARTNNAKKSIHPIGIHASQDNEKIQSPISLFNSPPSNLVPKSTTIKHRGRNSSSGSEPELVPMVKKIDETWGYENIMRESKKRIKLNKSDTIQSLSTPKLSYDSKLQTSNESNTLSTRSISGGMKIETNPDLVSSLLKESLYDPKTSIVAPLITTEPLIKMENDIDTENKQLNISENSTKSISLVQPIEESENNDLDSNDSKLKLDKKKKKKEHKTKDRDKEKRKKHKKDKERNKERDDIDTTVTTTSVSGGPSLLKITIPKDKITMPNTSGHRTQTGIKIKIPKEKLIDDNPKVSTTYTSAGVSDANKPGLKIKISKEVIDSYPDPGKKRERDFSVGKSPPNKAPKVSKQQIINPKKGDNHKSSSSKVSDQSWDSKNNVDKTVVGKRDNKYNYNNDNRYGYDRYDKKYPHKESNTRSRNFHTNNNEYDKDRIYFNRNPPIMQQRVPEMNPYFYYPHTYPPPPMNQFMYPPEMYTQPNPQYPGPYYPHIYQNDAFYGTVIPPQIMGTAVPEVSPIIASAPAAAPPLPQGPPPEIPPPPPPPE